MRSRRAAPENEEREAAEGAAFVVESDTVNEQVILAAALVDDVARERLLRKLRPEHFFHDKNREAWAALTDLGRKKLAFDFATLQRNAGGRVDVDYLVKLIDVRPEPPENLDFHLDAMHWDHARLTAVRGPVTALLEAVRDPRSEPERVRALARQVSSAFDGHGSTHLHDGRALVSEAMRELEEQFAGRSCWPYGVEGLDYDVQEGRRARRMLPGAAPGQITVLTASSGSGKSSFAAHMALGLARQRRRVVYAAWEPQAAMTLKLLACISLGWRRRDIVDPNGAHEDSPIRTPEGRRQLEECMHAIGRYVTFMRNPFRRSKGSKRSNERNLDVVQENLADAGADVFIADLWERCLHEADPGEEKEALFRQQAMAEEMRVHCVLLAQQRLKDVEQRPDKRPTREGIKGSGAWTEVADTILGLHLPALWKDVPDDRMEVFVLKQRWGKWPLGVEFEWDGDTGGIAGGRPIRYEHAGEMSDANPLDVHVRKAAGGGRGWRR